MLVETVKAWLETWWKFLLDLLKKKKWPKLKKKLRKMFIAELLVL